MIVPILLSPTNKRIFDEYKGGGIVQIMDFDEISESMELDKMLKV